MRCNLVQLVLGMHWQVVPASHRARSHTDAVATNQPLQRKEMVEILSSMHTKYSNCGNTQP